MKQINLRIEGMTCQACSNGLEKYLNKQKNITAKVNLVLATATINYDEKQVKLSDLERFVKEAGFKVVKDDTSKYNHHLSLFLIIFFSIMALFTMYLSMGSMFNIPLPNILNKMIHPEIHVIILLIFAILALGWGFDIIKSGIKNLFHLMPNMDSLIGMGVLVNFGFSLYRAFLIFEGKNYVNDLYFDAVIMIILFVKIGRFIDHKNKDQAVDAIKNLVTLTPKEALVLKDKQEIKIPINEVQKGDILIAKPGDKIAVDGIVTKGSTHTDESFITGESKPIKKQKGSLCLAGSLNYDGYIEYEALHIGKDSSVSKIVDLVVASTLEKPKIARLADKISGYFVPFIFLVALLAFILNMLISSNISESIEALVTVLVVACPCALGLATPLAMVVALGKASLHGLVIKNSQTLEELNRIDTIIFDKTGTLTKGNLEIVDFKINPSYNEKETFKILQSLESHSNHPLAVSICKNTSNYLEVTNFKENKGLGIQGKIKNTMYYAGNLKFLNKTKIMNNFLLEEKKYEEKGESIIYLWHDTELIAIFGLRDELKPGIAKTIQDLKKLSKKVVMLSGDNEISAKVIAKEIGIDIVYANQSFQEKVAIVKKLNTNSSVIMVGDGINDAPSLKAATIGISVAGCSAISKDAADIIMLNPDMHKLIDLFKLGKKTILIIKQNLFWALFYNSLMIPLATNLFALKLNPMFASFAMVISSLTVVLNSLRLKKN